MPVKIEVGETDDPYFIALLDSLVSGLVKRETPEGLWIIKGPLLNTAGEVVGVNTMKIVDPTLSGINFSLASSEIAELLRSRFGTSLTQPIATAPAISIVAITSAPEGADFEVDGAFLGSSPAELLLPVVSERSRSQRRAIRRSRESCKLAVMVRWAMATERMRLGLTRSRETSSRLHSSADPHRPELCPVTKIYITLSRVGLRIRTCRTGIRCLRRTGSTWLLISRHSRHAGKAKKQARSSRFHRNQLSHHRASRMAQNCFRKWNAGNATGNKAVEMDHRLLH